MGVKYVRKYSDIIDELSLALVDMEKINELFYMEEVYWLALTKEERIEYINTLADDIIYALGDQSSIAVGTGNVEYDNKRNVIKVYYGPKITVVNLT